LSRYKIALLLIFTLAALVAFVAAGFYQYNLEFTAAADAAKLPEAELSRSDTNLAGNLSEEYNLVKVQRLNVPVTIKVSGTVQPEDQHFVVTEKGGLVTGVDIDTGTRVGPGVILARLENSAEMERLAAHEKKLRTLHLKYINADLYNRLGKISESEFQKYRQEYDKARLEHSRLQDIAESYIIRAPVSGIVFWKGISKGDNLKPGQRTFAIGNSETLHIPVQLKKSEAEIISNDSEVFTVLSGEEKTILSGTINRIYDTGNGNNPDCTASISIPPSRLPAIETQADVYIKTETNTSAIMIPSSAVMETPEGKAVWRAKRTGSNEYEIGLSYIEVRITDPLSFSVKNGLSEGDLILASPAETLHEGSKIENASVYTYQDILRREAEKRRSSEDCNCDCKKGR
jgi:RND family efflux transporter MFP subunit